ncbi:MAG: amino acid adenylation domain-containing protein [Proteobacteria bacterium]|nr:amino acid adenylation domain-containing protein [Pseudomonadota bacterium]MBU1715002.1 amino acid adenylation domain-containing protein [Pseudomonadota bacterium]
MIEKKNIKNIYALSPLQEGMLFHSLQDPDSLAYFQQMSYRISGKLEVPIFEQSWNELLGRHDALRTIFIHKNVPEPLQIVLKERKIDFMFNDQRGPEVKDRDALVEEFKRLDRARPFILSKDVLMRVSVLQFAEESFEVIWSFPHIIMDGWCLYIIKEELFEIYRCLLNGQPLALPSVTPYSIFIKWYTKQNRVASEDYWQEYLSGYKNLSHLPQKSTAQHNNDYDLQTTWIELDRDRFAALSELAARNLVTINTVIQCLWGILLSRYNDTDDSVFGMTVSGRPPEIPGIERMIGLFINTVPVRIKTGEGRTFRELLTETQARFMQGRDHHQYPLAAIQAKIPLRQELFDHIMIFENYPIKEGLTKAVEASSGLAFERFTMFEQTNYGLGISVFPEEKLLFRFTYNAAIYDDQTMKAIGEHITEMVDAVLENETIKVEAIEIISAAEKETILTKFNQPTAMIQAEKTLVELFEEQVERTPEAVAVVCGIEQLTFRELNARANIVAHHLRDNCGVRPDVPVGLMAARSEWLPIGIIGILKAGGAYVPIDPDFPPARIDYILKKSACQILLVDLAEQEKLREKLSIELCDFRLIKGTNNRNPAQVVSSDHLAYTIYTSGSTGDPKGVMVTHRNLANFNLNLIEVFGLRQTDTMLALTTISFDISVLELLNSLLVGMKVVISPDAAIKNPEKILQTIREAEISVLQLTPSRLRMLLTEGDPAALATLRVLLIGGESLPEDLFALLRPLLSEVEIFNVYGPTETTIWSTCKKINDGILTIGSPLVNESIYILSANNRLMPVGTIGEICIGGRGVTRGYHHQPELTAEKFISNPFNREERLYRTGDLGRFRPDGQIECLGRNDDQIKIRGYRIEPGEIERRLKSRPAIKNAVVVPIELTAGAKDLVAYCLGEEELGVAAWREYLGQWLPDYMLPTYFIYLAKFPLTPTGKIDKKALPLPDQKDERSPEEYRAPSTVSQIKLAEIWQEVLAKKLISVQQDFFEAGGHSLKAILIISRINRILGVDLSIKELFNNPTIEKLGLLIEQKSSATLSPIAVIPEQPSYPVSHGQRRLWILDRMETELVAYTIPAAFLLEGELNRPALRQAFELLLARHESLRTTFDELDGSPVQKVRPDCRFEIREIDLTLEPRKDKVELAHELIVREAAIPFDLSRGPLIRAILLKIDERRQVLALIIHHIISDGWSFLVLEKDLLTLYQAIAGGKRPELPPLPIQYKDYAAWQNNFLQTEMILPQRQYWQHKLSGELTVLDLPTDFPRPPIKTFRGKTISFRLDHELAAALHTAGTIHGATLFMVLLATLKILLFRYSGQEDCIIGSPIAGRNHPDLENQIGFYVNILVLRDTLTGNDSFKTLLGQVKQTALEAYEHQDYPFDLLVEELAVNRETSRSPLFDVMLVLQNNEQATAPAVDLKISALEIDPGISQFDLTFNFIEQPEALSFYINYNTDIFTEERILRMGEHFRELVKSLAADPDCKIDLLNILPSGEMTRLLEEFNATGKDYPADQTIVDLFEEQVRQTPNHLAVVFEDKNLTYQQLNAEVNRLAHYLRETLGVQPDEPVAVMINRSEWLLIGLLATMKAGGAYLPVDPAYPEQRIRYILADSGCRVMLTEEKYLTPEITINPENKLTIIEIKSALPRNESNPAKVNKAEDLAYIIYTSGSTGRPKGVMIEHGGFINMSLAQITTFGVTEQDAVGHFASPSFDASLSEIFMALFCGARVVMISQETISDPTRFVKYLAAKGITILTLPPVYLNSLEKTELPTVRTLITAGESAVVKDALAYSRDKKYFNAYGPTEASVCVSCHQVDPEYPYPGSIPIGKPIANTRVYIVDQACNPVPIGVYGEICVTGAGLARGYLNRSELTEEKFRENPLKTGERLYLSGDIGRWREDGNLEWAWRKDQQVKVRGYRIELGEIEARLREHGEIREAVVAAKEVDGSKELTAYLTSSREINVVQLREHLAKTLPSYMIPACFVRLASLPLTPNGKIDQKALPDPVVLDLAVSSRYSAPESELERQLANIWQKILDRKKIGAHDNFFELGGNSMKSLRIVSLLRNDAGIELSPMTIYQTPTIRGLAEYIERSRSTPAEVREEAFVRLNKGAGKKIFCFPPFPGYAGVYQELASYLSEYDLGGFNFLPDDTLLTRYAALIKNGGQQGPLIFLGHSGGGNLAFELAKAMANDGEPISDLIMIDTWKREQIILLSKEERDEIMTSYQTNLFPGKTGPAAGVRNNQRRGNDLDKMMQYLDYIDSTVNTGKVAGRIHLIKAEEKQAPATNTMQGLSREWGDSTTGGFKIYNGFGSHNEMLSGPNLQKNLYLIREILDDNARRIIPPTK